MKQNKSTHSEDKYFIPLADKKVTRPVALTESDSFEMADLESFTLKPRKLKFLKPVIYSFGVLLAALTSWELFRFYQALYTWHWTAAAVFAGVSVVCLGFLLRLVREFGGQQQEFERVLELQEQADSFLHENHFGRSLPWLTRLRELYQDKPQAALLESALDTMPDYASDAEIVTHMQ